MKGTKMNKVMPADLEEAMEEFEEYARCAEATKDPEAESDCDKARENLKAIILSHIK